MVELKRSARKGVFRPRFPVDQCDEHRRRGSCKSCADAPLAACMKEELRHGRQRNESHSVYSVYLTAMGREEEAVSEIRMAQELDPLSLPINTDVGFELYYSGHYEQAIEQLQFVLDLNPRFPLANLWMGRAYQQKRNSTWRSPDSSKLPMPGLNGR
jgi:tetratricopeptide (TPR) repeat protein